MKPAPTASCGGGFALITVLLLLIGLAVLATGLVFAAAQQATVAGSAHDVARARRAAEAALGHAIENWIATERARDPTGRATGLVDPTTLEPGVIMSAQARRLTGDLFLVHGIGSASRQGTATIEQSASRLVRSLDADRVGRGLDAALIVGAATIAAGVIVDGLSPDSTPHDPLAADLCARWPVLGAALRASPDSLRVSAGAATAGVPPLIADTNAIRFLDGLGFLDLGTLARTARSIDAPSLTPAPVSDGVRCDTAAAGNWGSGAGPCAHYWPLLHAPADLTLAGGYGQGILIADGDLVLDGGIQWRGLVLARGEVIVRDARIEGVVVAARLNLEAGSASLDRCALASALVASAPIRAAHPPARSWLPAFD